MHENTEQPEIGTQFKKMAEHFVGFAQDDPYTGGFGVILNYSLASIAALDELHNKFHGTEGDAPGEQKYIPSDGKHAMIMQTGAYLGESIRRMVGGSWKNDPANPRNIFAVAIEFESGEEVRPFSALYLRFKNGVKDSLFPMVLDVFIAKFPEKLPQMAEGFRQQAAVFEQKKKSDLVLFFNNLAERLASPF